MTERKIYLHVPDAAPIRQGDVIRTEDASGAGTPGWCIVVTADCDIAQGKMGSFYTCLEVISASDYLHDYWAADELHKLRRKHEDVAINLIVAADRLRDPEVAPLSYADLRDWLSADGSKKMLSLLKLGKKAEEDCGRALTIIDCSYDTSKSALIRLRTIWSLMKRSPKEQEGAIKGAVKAGQMRSDYILLPGLPGETEVGFVVLLRAIRSVSPSVIHTSRLAFRISGAENGFYRLGRLEDYLRYAIAQRWASLYSRIGMTDYFEAECETASELVLAQL